jgi:hypothetical protein
MRRPNVADVARGVGASAVGTFAMDLLLYRGYRRGGGASSFGAWESSAGLESWDDAPAPARAAKRLIEAVRRRELPATHVRALNNVTHWAFGLAAGASYGLLVGGVSTPKVRYGVPFGTGVWLGGYAVLPALGVYCQIWQYDLETLGEDLGAHLVFGVATAGAYRAIAPRQALRSRLRMRSSLH